MKSWTYQPERHRARCDLDLRTGVPTSSHESVDDWVSTIQEQDIRCYPNSDRLAARYAQIVGLPQDWVAVTAGSDDAIDRVCRMSLEPGEKALWTTPGFSMFPRCVAFCRAQLVGIPWTKDPFPLAEYIDSVDAQTRLLILVAPQNPTGAQIPRSVIEALAQRFQDRRILLDEAYAEFSVTDRLELVRDYPNLVVIRTMSKARGGAGLRVGFALGQPATIRLLKGAGSPFPVAGPSLRLAYAMLEQSPQIDVGAAVQEREALQALARELGDTVSSSQSNFVLWESQRAYWLHDGLAGLGIATRRFSEPGMEKQVRIGCPGHASSFIRLGRSLQCVLAPNLILLDLDGVVFDVSASYRAAMIATAATFGVTLTAQDIEKAKHEGNANDDWSLTHRLITAAGVKASLVEVTEQFEALFQDGPTTPGLWRQEALLASRTLLSRLSKAVPLGVVTGRPRLDAMRSLEAHRLLDLLEVVITREDAALKPSPDPVLLAMTRVHGAEARAWYVGDTPDDMVAGRSAGAVPIGHAPPGSNVQALEDVLFDAGASRVLTSLDPLLEMLS